MTQKQKNDIECIRWFIPTNMDYPEITQEDEIMFLELSEKGWHKDKINQFSKDGFNALVEGKRWRGVHIHELYEKGVLDGSMPYYTILGGNDILVKRKWWQFWKPEHTFKHNPVPRVVVDFLKKEMFQGIDSEVIERCYQSLLK